MAERALWTLDELVRRVAVSLADPAYPGAPNGRVRELPDRRAVRWYTTAGLVDPPAKQGRTAVYSPRHLLQIVAVKRLQARGLSLAEIQAELAGATDATLRKVAAVPDVVIAQSGPTSQETPVPGRRNRFWAAPPAAEPAAEPAAKGADPVTTLAAVHLPGGALLVLPAAPDEDDIDAIHTAARPLLELLADRGLLSGPPLDERSPS
ncbi:MerR family transcriptional regulator [Mycobacterium ostraviense]|uniref:MerR family transcriptional regulator n=1 Tax=Mycobacterium ostraviense TaxID=2738409 RepID=UPI00094C2680|nr:MerR family transcriptional regulator [Mycobacterium ostraviense]UGT93031.1 MerR family transcriptional regulator [Mycobacterium ostraviense]